MEIRNENKKSQLVFDPRVARSLCKKGFYIVDIKPMRGEPDKTVFVFDNTEDFRVAFVQIMDEIKVKNNTEPEQLTFDVD